MSFSEDSFIKPLFCSWAVFEVSIMHQKKQHNVVLPFLFPTEHEWFGKGTWWTYIYIHMWKYLLLDIIGIYTLNITHQKYLKIFNRKFLFIFSIPSPRRCAWRRHPITAIVAKDAIASRATQKPMGIYDWWLYMAIWLGHIISSGFVSHISVAPVPKQFVRPKRQLRRGCQTFGGSKWSKRNRKWRILNHIVHMFVYWYYKYVSTMNSTNQSIHTFLRFFFNSTWH